MPVCTARCTWRACAGGSTCDAPRDAPSSVQAQPQPSSLGCVSRPQICRRAGSGAGPLRLCARALILAGLKSRLHRATSSLLVYPEERQAVPPIKPPRGWAEPGRGAGGGGRGALPAVTSGASRGALPWQPRFHLVEFPGAAPSHSVFSSMGCWGWGEGSEGPTPPLCDFGSFCCLSLGFPLRPCHTLWASTSGSDRPPWGC